MQSAMKSKIEDAIRTMTSRTRFSRVVLSLIVIVIWVVLYRCVEPFRSHFGLTILGSGMSAIVAGLIVYWLSRRKYSGPAA
jgi:preprotein translocase subunit SecF